MPTATNIRHLLRELRSLIDAWQYENLAFAISNFELYLSGDEYAEGDEFRKLITQFEELLDHLYEETSPLPGIDLEDSDSVKQLNYAIEEYLGELGYDWNYGPGAWLE